MCHRKGQGKVRGLERGGEGQGRKGPGRFKYSREFVTTAAATAAWSTEAVVGKTAATETAIPTAEFTATV